MMMWSVLFGAGLFLWENAMRKITVFILITFVLLLIFQPVIASDRQSFYQISKPYIEKYGKPDVYRRQFEKQDNKIVWDVRAYIWTEQNYYVVFAKNKQWFKGWVVLQEGQLRRTA